MKGTDLFYGMNYVEDRYKIAAKNPHASVWDESRFSFT